MEVHYHPNLHKKKIYEYLIEFVLIFSAVTLGFFAENYREKIVLEEQTSKIIVQLHSELKKDLIDLNKTITIRRKNDSLNNLLYYIVSKNQIEKNKTILYCIQHRLLNSTGNFETNTLSIKELENTSLFKK